eukprot:6652081-Pyramimonas_sp.AAC.1
MTAELRQLDHALQAVIRPSVTIQPPNAPRTLLHFPSQETRRSRETRQGISTRSSGVGTEHPSHLMREHEGAIPLPRRESAARNDVGRCWPVVLAKCIDCLRPRSRRTLQERLIAPPPLRRRCVVVAPSHTNRHLTATALRRCCGVSSRWAREKVSHRTLKLVGEVNEDFAAYNLLLNPMGGFPAHIGSTDAGASSKYNTVSTKFNFDSPPKPPRAASPALTPCT